MYNPHITKTDLCAPRPCFVSTWVLVISASLNSTPLGAFSYKTLLLGSFFVQDSTAWELFRTRLHCLGAFSYTALLLGSFFVQDSTACELFRTRLHYLGAFSWVNFYVIINTRVDCLSTFYSDTYYSTFPTSNLQHLISKCIVLFLFHLNWAHSFTFWYFPSCDPLFWYIFK